MEDPADGLSETSTGPSAYVAFGAAIDNPGLAFSGGGRYRLEAWSLGLDGEFNPWISIETQRLAPGVASFYATLIRHYRINRDVALRTTVHLGTSVLLFDLIGAPSGSVGLFFGVSLIGLEFRLTDYLTLVVDPGDFVVPAPHITGAPLTYHQYRFTVGLQMF